MGAVAGKAAAEKGISARATLGDMATASPPTSLDSLLVSRPGYREGRPCLRGTGITVHAVAAAHIMGATAEQLCAENPDLDPALFHAALAYYYCHQDQIKADIDADIVEGERLAKLSQEELVAEFLDKPRA